MANYRPLQLSLIVPLRADAGSIRERNWRWLRKYWANELPNAELIIGRSSSTVFSKTEAVNNGVSRSHGRILAIVDADAYVPGTVIKGAADDLDETLARGIPRWYVPYNALYRLTEATTEAVMASNPLHPLRMATPPPDEQVESTLGSMHGRRYGAMLQIYPREAFDLVGGMDTRFVGWGGEDIAFARALDTLYAKHKTTDNDICHLWHPKINVDPLTRAWEGQTNYTANMLLASRYNRATDDREKMRALVDEGIEYGTLSARLSRLAAGVWSWLTGFTQTGGEA